MIVPHSLHPPLKISTTRRVLLYPALIFQLGLQQTYTSGEQWSPRSAHLEWPGQRRFSPSATRPADSAPTLRGGPSTYTKPYRPLTGQPVWWRLHKALTGRREVPAPV